MAYGIHDLELKGLQVKTILSVHISHKPGEHGQMELMADMGESNMDIPIHETESGQAVTLFCKRAGERKTLFCGIITNLTAQSMGKSCHVKLIAKTWSYQMDVKQKSRSFQDTTMTYGDLVSKIVGEYPGAECQILFEDSPLGEIAVQYKETDWQFIKRVLSDKYVPLVCSEVREKLCLYAGVAQIPASIDMVSIDRIWKDMGRLFYWREIGADVKDTDFITYHIKLNNFVMLYSNIDFEKKELTVGEVEYVTNGSVVYEHITLQRKEGLLQETIYPMQLVGTALEGTIRDVEGENVKIHLRIDDDYLSNDCYWFPISTPSASSDGSGWYCMPEKGDKVRVYFPSKRTGDVIAISAVSSYQPPQESAKNQNDFRGGSNNQGESSNNQGENGNAGFAISYGTVQESVTSGTVAQNVEGEKAEGLQEDKMSDSATKYLCTVDGHEIKLSPSGIVVQCGGSTAKVEILKNGKINMYAQQGIQIKADMNIAFEAKRIMNIHCAEQAWMISSKGGSMNLDEEGKVKIKGTELYIN